MLFFFLLSQKKQNILNSIEDFAVHFLLIGDDSTRNDME